MSIIDAKPKTYSRSVVDNTLNAIKIVTKKSANSDDVFESSRRRRIEVPYVYSGQPYSFAITDLQKLSQI